MTTLMNDRFRVMDKDPDYHYRWCLNRDNKMQERIWDGWEPVLRKDSQPPLPPDIAKAVGQSTENPAGGSLMTRGDLVLMRMRNEAFEEKIAAPKRAAAERQKASMDTMVAQANENAQRAARNAGLKNIPKEMAFQTTDDGQFDDAKK